MFPWEYVCYETLKEQYNIAIICLQFIKNDQCGLYYMELVRRGLLCTYVLSLLVDISCVSILMTILMPLSLILRISSP
jgi:hypothetical protein